MAIYGQDNKPFTLRSRAVLKQGDHPSVVPAPSPYEGAFEGGHIIIHQRSNALFCLLLSPPWTVPPGPGRAARNVTELARELIMGTFVPAAIIPVKFGGTVPAALAPLSTSASFAIGQEDGVGSSGLSYRTTGIAHLTFSRLTSLIPAATRQDFGFLAFAVLDGINTAGVASRVLGRTPAILCPGMTIEIDTARMPVYASGPTKEVSGRIDIEAVRVVGTTETRQPSASNIDYWAGGGVAVTDQGLPVRGELRMTGVAHAVGLAPEDLDGVWEIDGHEWVLFTAQNLDRGASRVILSRRTG